MQRRRLGGSQVTVTALGLGTAPIGNLFSEVVEADAIATLETAAAHGIAWFDTAPFYGLWLAESRLGHFLETAPPGSFTLSTKVGRYLVPAPDEVPPPHFVNVPAVRPVFDYSADGIRRSLLESLERLGRDHVDLALLHDVDRGWHKAAHRELVETLLNQSIPTLQLLRSEGLIGAIGLGINEWEVGYELMLAAELDAILLAGRYTLLEHGAFTSGFLDTCLRRGVSVLLGGVFNSGLLAGGDTYHYAAAPPEIRQRTEHMKRICRDHDVDLPAAALQFAAAHPATTSVVVGARSAREVSEIVDWWSTAIPAELWEALKRDECIPADAPVPGSV